MGPLFSLILMAIASSIAILVAYIVARFLFSPGRALLAAWLFVIGGAFGAAASLALLALAMGTGASLENGWQVLACLSAGGLLCGSAAVWFCFKVRAERR